MGKAKILDITDIVNRISLRVLRDFEKGKNCQKRENRGNFLDRAKAKKMHIYAFLNYLFNIGSYSNVLICFFLILY